MTSQSEPATIYWLNNALYLNITNQCSNRCWFCFRNFKQGVGDFNLKLKTDPTEAQVKAELEAALPKRHWSEAVFCGFGEPTARLDLLLELAHYIRTRSHLPVRLDTNGHGCRLNPEREIAAELKAAGVSKVSVSLNGYDEVSYADNCRPTFEGAYAKTVEFVRRAKAAGLDVEVSALRMPEVDIEKVRAVADELGVPLRVRDYVPCFW
jgi:GTP 3',8-cyclase